MLASEGHTCHLCEPTHLLTLQHIIEACRWEAAAAAERQRLSRQLLEVAPRLGLVDLRVRSVYGSGALHMTVCRKS